MVARAITGNRRAILVGWLAAFVALIASSGSAIAWTLISHQMCNGNSGCTTSAISTIGANLLVIHTAAQGCSAAAQTPTDSQSNTWTKAAGQGNGTLAGDDIFFAAPPSTSASHTFTLPACNTGSTNGSLELQAWSGAASSPADQGNQSGSSVTGSSASPQAGSITPAKNGALVVAAAEHDTTNTTAITIGSGFTISDSFTNGSAPPYSSGMAYLVQGTAAAVNPAWTWGASAGWAATVASFLPGCIPGSLVLMGVGC